MSRSRKHHPIGGNTNASSEQEDKRIANRAFRRITRSGLRNQQEQDSLPQDLDEVSNVWSWSKDGRGWYNPKDPKSWRK